MPRYFLHIRNSTNRVQDLEGEDLNGLALAVEAAIDSARDVLVARLRAHQRADGVGSQIEISDEAGNVLARVEFTDIVSGKL